MNRTCSLPVHIKIGFFSGIILFACTACSLKSNVSSVNGKVTSNTVTTTTTVAQSELDAIATNSAYVNWRVARTFSLVELEARRRDSGWQGAKLSALPIVIYDAYGNPEYYEYRVTKGGVDIAAITCVAKKTHGGPIAYVLPTAPDYSSLSVSSSRRLIANGYPRVAVATVKRAGIRVKDAEDVTGTNVDVEEDPLEYALQNPELLTNTNLTLDMITNAASALIQSNLNSWSNVDASLTNFLIASTNDDVMEMIGTVLATQQQQNAPRRKAVNFTGPGGGRVITGFTGKPGGWWDHNYLGTSNALNWNATQFSGSPWWQSYWWCGPVDVGMMMYYYYLHGDITYAELSRIIDVTSFHQTKFTNLIHVSASINNPVVITNETNLSLPIYSGGFMQPTYQLLFNSNSNVSIQNIDISDISYTSGSFCGVSKKLLTNGYNFTFTLEGDGGTVQCKLLYVINYHPANCNDTNCAIKLSGNYISDTWISTNISTSGMNYGSSGNPLYYLINTSSGTNNTLDNVEVLNPIYTGGSVTSCSVSNVTSGKMISFQLSGIGGSLNYDLRYYITFNPTNYDDTNMYVMLCGDYCAVENYSCNNPSYALDQNGYSNLCSVMGISDPNNASGINGATFGWNISSGVSWISDNKISFYTYYPIMDSVTSLVGLDSWTSGTRSIEADDPFQSVRTGFTPWSGINDGALHYRTGVGYRDNSTWVDEAQVYLESHTFDFWGVCIVVYYPVIDIICQYFEKRYFLYVDDGAEGAYVNNNLMDREYPATTDGSYMTNLFWENKNTTLEYLICQYNFRSR